LKWTEKELLQAAQTIKEYCHSTCCIRCIFGNNEETRKIKGAKETYTIVTKPVRCKLQDRYGKPHPRCWDLDAVQIKENTLF
jgi:hypothetical protein